MHNTTQDSWYYYIQDAIDNASDGDEVVINEGTYYESIDFKDKAITARSKDPLYVRILHLFDEKGKLLISVGVLDNSQAIVYSLVASCKLCEIDPFEYLRDVLDRVSTHPASRIAELTPSGWNRYLAARI